MPENPDNPPCPQCGSTDSKTKYKRKFKKRFICNKCGHLWTIQEERLPKSVGSQDIEVLIDQFQGNVKKILSRFKEFSKLPPDTAESMLVASALTTMVNPLAPSAAKASARDYISDMIKTYAPSQEGEVTISFVDPSMVGVLTNVEEEIVDIKKETK